MLQHSCLQLVSTNSRSPPQMLGSALCHLAGHPGFNQCFGENDGAQAVIQGVLK